MKIGLISTCFLILFSCKNATVDLQSLSISSNAALIKLTDGKQVSPNQFPNFTLTYYYEDRMVSSLAIYDSSTCVESMKVGAISNQIGSTITSNLQLSEGNHNFYYKPVSSSAELNLTALCNPTGLNYTIDTIPPNALMLSLVSAYLTADRNVGLTVAGCENNMTGASSLVFKELSSPIPLASDVGWQNCQPSQVFTISPSLGIKNIFVFSKDEAGNVSTTSGGVSVTLTTSPIISAPANPLVSYFNDLKNLPFTFLNAGGIITGCTSSPALPAGLTLIVSTDPMTGFTKCIITGLPSIVSANNSYQITAAGVAGAVSSTVSINIEVKPLPAADINFNQAAGPANPHLTFLNANIGGTNVVAYNFFVGYSPTFDCGSVPPASYSIEVNVLSPIFKSLFTNSEGSRTLCVRGKNSDNVWQQVATSVSWTQGPMLQRLVDDFILPSSRVITMYDQPFFPVTDIISRKFLVGGSSLNQTIICQSANCSVKKVGTGSWFTSLTGLAPSDIVQIRLNAVTTTNTAGTLTFYVNGDTVNPYTFKIQTAAATCASLSKRIFISSGSHFGNLGGVTGADMKCNSEASALVIGGSWRALLTTSMSNGLAPGNFSATQYCDAFSNRPILAGAAMFQYSFDRPFTNFVNGDVVNGGNDTEWKYIENAPRYLSATEFWSGSSTGNCNNWTSSDFVSSGDAGRLTHESSADNPLKYFPGSTGTSLIQGSCSQPRHLICYEQ